MVYPEDRVAGIVKLGPAEALVLSEAARGGDLMALADWTVRAVYRKLLASGLSPAAAIGGTKDLMRLVDLKPRLAL